MLGGTGAAPHVPEVTAGNHHSFGIGLLGLDFRAEQQAAGADTAKAGRHLGGQKTIDPLLLPGIADLSLRNAVRSVRWAGQPEFAREHNCWLISLGSGS